MIVTGRAAVVVAVLGGVVTLGFLVGLVRDKIVFQPGCLQIRVAVATIQRLYR